MRLHRRTPGGPEKLHSKLWLENIVAKLSNWIFKKVGEPQVFSTQWDQEPRYWKELKQYVKMLPLRVRGIVPPIPAKEVPHNQFHPYRANRLGPIETKELSVCYLEPPPTIVITQEQWDEEYNKAAEANPQGTGTWKDLEVPDADGHKD